MLDAYFQLQQNQTTVWRELIAGATTFIASAYIIVVNPAILSQAGMAYEAVLTATILVCVFSSLMMGLYAKNPILVAPGMGINAYFTYAIVLKQHIPVETALGAVFWSGVIFWLLSVFRIRNMILRAIPASVRLGSAAGIGLFIALIGFFNAGFIVVKTPFIGLGALNAITLTFVAGLALAATLAVKKIPGALILSMLLTTLLAYPIGRWYGDASSVNFGNPQLVSLQQWFSAPDFSLVFKLDLLGALHWSVLPAAFGLLFTDMFDSISTFVGVAEAGRMKDANGEPRRMEQSMIADSYATMFSGLFGSSPGTAYIESAAGVEAGGRTGLTAVFAGLLFVPFLFVAPLAKWVPAIATAPVLVIVGVYMMSVAARIAWDDCVEAIPAFIAMALIPLTYSITQGLIWGLLMYTVVKLATGRIRELPMTLWIIDGFAVLLLRLEVA